MFTEIAMLCLLIFCATFTVIVSVFVAEKVIEILLPSATVYGGRLYLTVRGWITTARNAVVNYYRKTRSSVYGMYTSGKNKVLSFRQREATAKA